MLINLVWDYPYNELLVTLETAVTDMISSVYNFLVLNFVHKAFCGGVSLLQNWILEGDEQGNSPVNAFVFLSITFGLFFWGGGGGANLLIK